MRSQIREVSGLKKVLFPVVVFVLSALLVPAAARKIDPIIEAAGVSAVPMTARVAQIEGQKANPRNFLLMHAVGPNLAGAIAASVVAGIFMSMV